MVLRGLNVLKCFVASLSMALTETIKVLIYSGYQDHIISILRSHRLLNVVRRQSYFTGPPGPPGPLVLHNFLIIISYLVSRSSPFIIIHTFHI